MKHHKVEPELRDIANTLQEAKFKLRTWEITKEDLLKVQEEANKRVLYIMQNDLIFKK